MPVGAYLDKIKDTPLVGTMKSNFSLHPCSCKIVHPAVPVEKILNIVYRQQAVFQTRPVNRISATIAGTSKVISFLFFS